MCCESISSKNIDDITGAGLQNDNKKIAFRVDASLLIGTGHLMRCLTLADALKQFGINSCFVSRHMPIHLRDLLVSKGHEFKLLSAMHNDSAISHLAHAKWLGVPQKCDAQDTIDALFGQSWDWLIVDHYGLDIHWESALRRAVGQIMVIDDIADRQHDCDVLVDQNLYEEMNSRYSDKVPKDCRLLLGPRYALLREKFRQLREQIKPNRGVVKNILVFFGGVDADNYTGRVIEALSAMDVSALHVNVVIGAQQPYREQIEVACKRYGFICHVQIDRMAELMVEADLSIGAGGGATWERCCLGLPALVLSTADNQKKQLTDAAKRGLVYAPDVDGDIENFVTRHVIALIENPSLRNFLSANGMQAVDARGALRIINALGNSSIEMRVATIDDSRDLFNWRNDPAIRAFSRNTESIAWHDHQHWLNAVLTDPSRILLVGLVQDMPVGVVRYDLEEKSAEISIYLVPDKFSSGLGTELLLAAEMWLRKKLPMVRSIHAHVLGGNERSMRLFDSAGYASELTRFTKRLKQDE